MNTYDPADCIVYIHMARQVAHEVAPVWSTGAPDRLSPGYANESSLTRLTGSSSVRHPRAGKSRRVALPACSAAYPAVASWRGR
jgi:hypothetical protein